VFDKLLEAHYAALLKNSEVYSADMQLAHRRQADGAAFDMRLLGGALTNAIVSSDDPATFAGYNAAVRVPTTIDQPSAVVNK
jgi:hypothetical protein